MNAFVTVLCILFSVLSYGQSPDCKKFHNGKFYIQKDGITGTTIERLGNVQFETDESQGLRIQLEVNWLDECTYTLRLVEVIQNDNNRPFNKDIVVMVEIISTENNGYTQRSTIEGVDGVYESKMIKID